MSVELYQQQQAISELQQCEEELIDQHKLMNEFLHKFIPESQSLYDTTDCVDYDQDGELEKRKETHKLNAAQTFPPFRILQTWRRTVFTTRRFGDRLQGLDGRFPHQVGRRRVDVAQNKAGRPIRAPRKNSIMSISRLLIFLYHFYFFAAPRQLFTHHHTNDDDDDDSLY